jgi:hypothetical protein
MDFDGVIHSYTSGWQGAHVVADRPVPGAFNFLREAVREFQVEVYSGRSHQPGGIEAMKQWIAFWNKGDPRGAIPELVWATEKPLARVALDDRVLTFRGAWPSIDSLMAFKPWYK